MMTSLPRLLFILAAVFALTSCGDVTAPSAPLLDRESAALDRGHGDDDDDDDDHKRDAVQCRNMVLTGTLADVYIPPGFNCWIRNATVRGHVWGSRPMNVEISTSSVTGNIKIRGGGQLHEYIIIDHLVGHGNIHIERRSGGGIWLGNSQVRGNVKLDKNVVTNFLHVARSTIVHDLHVFHNVVTNPAYLMANDNDVGQNLQVFHTAGNGNKVIVENRVEKNLQCFGNDTPFIGQPNQARRAHGQCGGTGVGR